MGMSSCSKCGKTMQDNQFYTYKNGNKMELCKKCLTMHIDNFRPDTFLWILEKMDTPWVPEEWNTLREKAYAKDPTKVNGMSILGKYLSKFRLRQWVNPFTNELYGWADSEFLQNKNKEMREAASGPIDLAGQRQALQEKFDAGEISEAEYRTFMDTETQLNTLSLDAADPTIGSDNAYDERKFVSEDVLPDPAADLTEEDKVYLAMKWGRLYKLNELVALETNYVEYEKSFDLHNADLRRGTLQLCKLDLKCNQALDCGDVDGYSKLSRASDTLRKSLKFTEAQRKEEKSAEFSCYGQIVAFCEKNNYDTFIPSVDLSIDRDIVDKDISDMKNWTKTLIEEDPTVFRMIEQYIKKREAAAEAEALGGEGIELSDKDLVDFRHEEDAQRRIDNGEEEEDD